VKKILRKELLLSRNSISAKDISFKSSEIIKRIKKTDFYNSSKIIAIYYPFRNEVDLLELLKDNTKIFCFPKVKKNSKILDFFVVKNVEELQKGAFGIFEPSINSTKILISDIELFLVPGVGFSKKGERLGYGGGFYDATLKHKSQTSFTIGVAFDCQITKMGFSESFDILMDEIVTETEEILLI